MWWQLNIFLKCTNLSPISRMSAARSPSVQLVCDEISLNEVKKAIKKAKNLSAPSPFDAIPYAIPYTIYKQCPSLAVALHSLFNTCWTTSAVPKHWKTDAIRLLAKGPAEELPSETSNFRPIALTPSTGKLFSTILRNRWLDFMLSNGYMNRSIQKAFLRVTLGCTEHHLKLESVLAEARKKHKSLSICWLDLANAYGSVHHSLIEYSLDHYHAPAQFQHILSAFYTDLSASVSTTEWSTQLIPWGWGCTRVTLCLAQF